MARYPKLTRRDFLKFSAAVGGGAFLAACAPRAAERCPAPTGAESIPMDELIRCAKLEGMLTTIALPHDWANYGEMIATYKLKYELFVNELDPDAGSAEELEAIRANKGSTGPQAPDVIDIGLGFTKVAKEEGLVAAYKVATWDTIPLKDPEGYWWGEYYGVLAFEVIKDRFPALPKDWEDLLDPMYAGSVAMAGDPTMSAQAQNTVFAAGLSRKGFTKLETVEQAVEAADAGLDFWAEMYRIGNFIPVIADMGRIAAGETPLVIEWDYLALANRDKLAGNPELEIIVPETGILAGAYAGGISAYAPHPYAARLWWEFVMSDEGQLIYLEGYAHPIRYTDLAARGVIPAELAAKLPPAEAYEKAIFPTVEMIAAVREHVAANWRSRVYGE